MKMAFVLILSLALFVGGSAQATSADDLRQSTRHKTLRHGSVDYRHPEHLKPEEEKEKVAALSQMQVDEFNGPRAHHLKTLFPEHAKYLLYVLFGVVTIFSLGLFPILVSLMQSLGAAETEEEEEKRNNTSVSEDTYGCATASLLRDLQRMDQGEGRPGLRASRLLFSLGLLAMHISLQCFFLYQIKLFVTAQWVHNIRADYSEYELEMYEVGSTQVLPDGQHRGYPKFFHPERFDGLDDGLKMRVCSIPFSQPAFFISVLLIWTLTCIAEIRQCWRMFKALIILAPLVESMSDALNDSKEELPDKERELVVNGLTPSVKFSMTFLIILPRFILTCVMLWLGCRFLAATNDFSELVLNAIALEFLIGIKDLLYMTIVPERNKRDTQKTEILPSTRYEVATYWSYLSTFVWAFIAVGWCFVYMYRIQTVLPGYRFDVHDLCSPWLLEEFAV